MIYLLSQFPICTWKVTMYIGIFLPRVSEKSQNFWCVFVKIENSTFALYTAASYIPTTVNEK